MSRLVTRQHTSSRAVARIGPTAPQMLRSAAIPLATTRLEPRGPLCKYGISTALNKPQPLQQRPSRARRSFVPPKAVFYGGYPSGPSGRSNFDRVAAASPQARQALLSNAISSCTDWRQLKGLVEQYGSYLTANHISHCLTKLEQLLAGQQLSTTEAAKVEDLLQWLMQQGRALNATGQLGPQALGATAGALARLQEAQRQQQLRRQQEQQLAWQRQQQQQQQQQQMLAQQRLQQEAAEERAKRAAAESDRQQLMQQLLKAAVAQRSRLTPQALDNILAGLASIDESGMSADEIRQLLNIPKRASSGAGSKPSAVRPSLDAAQQQQQQAEAAAQIRRQQEERERQQQLQWQQQQRAAPGDLHAAARQLGQLSPELAQEWHDRALRQSLEQGALPAGLDQRHLSGFLAREIDRAAERTRDSSSSSSSGRGAPATGAALLQGVLMRYAQLLRPPHFALIGHKLAELQGEGLAGSKQEVEVVASQLFQLCQPRIQSADAASISSLVSSCRELGLYSRTLVSAALARANTLLQAQLQGHQQQEEGFSARQLGVLLHSLAVLGLKPSDGWLRLAVLAAGELLPSCSLTDLERLASSFVLMRISPGRDFTAAAEAQLEQLAAAIGSSRGREPACTRALVGLDCSADELEESDSEEDADQTAVNARKALVACVKAVALLGGQRAARWYNNIVAQEEQQQRQQEEVQEHAGRGRQQQQAQAAAVEQRRQQQLLQQEQLERRQQEAEKEQQRQQDLLMQQQQQRGSKVTNEQLLENQLRKAVAQQQQRSKPHLHAHHRLQHRHKHKGDTSVTVDSNSSSSKGDLNALSSLDELMSQALQQQEQAASSNLPHATTSIQEASAGTEAGPTADTASFATKPPSSSSDSAVSSGSARPAAQQVESAAPATWAAEQTARWADSEGKQLRPAAELQQRLDDSKELFGSSKRHSSSSKNQQQHRKGNQDLSTDIEVQYEGTGSGGSSKGQQQQRSAADAASALAALMAEVDKQEVAESAQQEVQRELDALAAAAADDAMSLADIQTAADAVQQATEQLDDLQRRQQQQQHQHQPARQQQHKPASSENSKHQKKDKRHRHAATAVPRSGKAAAAAAPPPASKQQKPLGFTGEAAFVAAAKNLASAKPSRNYLLGCLEAIAMQQAELKQKLAAKQAMEAVAGAVQRQRTAAALEKNPLAKQIAQLQADFDRARKRIADEKAGVTAAAVADVATKLLPLLDSFDAALAAQQAAVEKGQGSGAADAAQVHTVYQGLNNQLLNILKSQGVVVIGEADDVVGTAFDPTHMEAVMRQPAPAGFADGDVLRVLRKGYAVGEKLVRPALVVVAYEE